MADTLSQKTKSGNLEWPNTNTDVTNMQKWTHGDEVLGTFANESKAWKRLRDDINRDFGNQGKYYSNVIYIDTFSPIGDQLKKFKR